MKTIVFIGTMKSGSSREAIKVAEQLGYYTVLLTGRSDFLDNRTDFNDVHLMRKCNLNKMSELRDTINNLISYGLDIKVIVSFLHARCYTAALLAEEFGLGAFPSQVMSKMKDKIISKDLISGAEYCPNYLTLSGDNALSEEELKKNLPTGWRDTEEEAKVNTNLAASKINFKLTSKPNSVIEKPNNVIEKVESDK